MRIDISKKDKAEVLAALYNASKPVSRGWMQFNSMPMSVEEARILLERTSYFDYIKGRVIKVDLSGNELETWLYDRDNGDGAAARVLSQVVDR